MSGPPPVVALVVTAAEEAVSPVVAVVSPVVVGLAPPAPPTPDVDCVLCWGTSTEPQAAVKIEAERRPVRIRGKARMNSSFGTMNQRANVARPSGGYRPEKEGGSIHENRTSVGPVRCEFVKLKS